MPPLRHTPARAQWQCVCEECERPRKARKVATVARKMLDAYQLQWSGHRWGNPPRQPFSPDLVKRLHHCEEQLFHEVYAMRLETVRQLYTLIPAIQMIYPNRRPLLKPLPEAFKPGPWAQEADLLLRLVALIREGR